jgi:uncharacterized protein (DUF952 family)
VRLFHIVAPTTWADAELIGEYVPAAYAADGFVHFSFADQVARVANARYRGEPELVVVEIESDEVKAELRVEDSYGAGEEFPHIYGAIPPAAARAVHPLTRTPDGDWVFNPDPSGPASPDR